MFRIEKLKIHNRKHQKVAIVLAKHDAEQGLVFIMHGLGGFKEQAHIQTIADAFSQQKYSVVLFDATNSLGESDGDYEHATVTGYYQDLEDVITWAAAQAWYQEPFVLCGHSLGGMCTALFAENNPQKILALAPVSPVVSGRLSIAHNQKTNPRFHQWKETGWTTRKSFSKPGIEKRLPWTHMEDRLRYDLLPLAPVLTMPVLLVVGELDQSTPVEQVRQFYKALPEQKTLRVISGAPHTFCDQTHLIELKSIFTQWISSFSRQKRNG